MKLFVTGVGTGVGKTLVSAFLVSHYEAAYWKPIQAGDLDDSDSMKIDRWTAKRALIYPEQYAFEKAASPHEAAACAGISMKLSDFSLPHSPSHLIVEGAGGLYVPLNDRAYMIDLVQHLALDVVVVIRDYLGVINHSLLTFEALRGRNIVVHSVVFNGSFNPYTKQAIQGFLPADCVYMTLPEYEGTDFNFNN